MRKRVVLAEPVRGTELGRALTTPARLLTSPEASWVKNHRRTAVASIWLDGHDVFVKRFKPYAWYRRLEAAVAASPAQVSWDNAHRLAKHGFSIPRPLALVEEGADSYFVTESVAGAEPAGDFWLREANRLDAAERLRIVRGAARTLRRFHDCGLYSRDTNANNFLIRPGHTADPEFVFLDLENVRQLRTVGRRRRVKNLVQFYRMFRDRIAAGRIVRFLFWYLGRDVAPKRLSAEERRDLRGWLRELGQVDRRKEAKYRARRRRSQPA